MRVLQYRGVLQYPAFPRGFLTNNVLWSLNKVYTVYQSHFVTFCERVQYVHGSFTKKYIWTTDQPLKTT